MKKILLLLILAVGTWLIPISASYGGPVEKNQTTTGDSVFKDWYYTPTAVFGRIPLSKPKYREYVKIIRQQDGPVSVQRYNAAEILINTTRVTFLNGRLSLITETNQWGATWDSLYFTFLGNDEFIVVRKTRGVNPYYPCRAIRCSYKNNLLREILCLADETKPGTNQEGVSHYVFERYSDPRRFGLTKTETFFGTIDDPVISRAADCHKLVTEYDENGNLISKSVFGLKDEPITDRYGNFKTTLKYDKNDENTETSYYDANGAAPVNSLGYAKVGREFRKGQLVQETYYGADYTIVKSSSRADSVGIIRYQYDDNGHQTEKTYYDDGDHLTNDRKGIYKTVSAYNASGMLTDLSYFNSKLQPATDETGAHHVHMEKNGKGQTVRVNLFDRFNLPLRDALEGAYEIRFSYDNWGRIASSSFWVNDSIKMVNRSGYHEIRPVYNSNGRVIQNSYYDINGKLTNGYKGYSIQKMRYNETGLLEEMGFFDDNKPVLFQQRNMFVSNFHSLRYTYDFYNRVKTVEYFDEGGKPYNASVRLDENTNIPCQRITYTYSADQVIQEQLDDSGTTVPPLVLDCLTRNCITPTGTSILMRKPTFLADIEPDRRVFRNITIMDSVFFDNQLTFLGKDSILIFLNASANRLSEQECAGLYRIGTINKYYQMDGNITDYYLQNDSVAARLIYERGNLNGPCSFYYANGNVRERGLYRQNARTGTWEYFYEDGQKEKTIKFTEVGTFLIDYYAANGKPLVQNGNGRFEGLVNTWDIRLFPVPDHVEGDIRNGLQDGEWKIFTGPQGKLMYTEKFSSGRFIKGKMNGNIEYNKTSHCRFENPHQGELLDHYGQEKFCSFRPLILAGHGEAMTATGTLQVNFFTGLNEGFKNILSSKKYSDYSGWVFVDLKYTAYGQILKKYVRLYQTNPAFEKDILDMLERFDNLPPVIVNGNPYPFEKFYILLVEGNEVVIPEEVLMKSRGEDMPTR